MSVSLDKDPIQHLKDVINQALWDLGTTTDKSGTLMARPFTVEESSQRVLRRFPDELCTDEMIQEPIDLALLKPRTEDDDDG